MVRAAIAATVLTLTTSAGAQTMAPPLAAGETLLEVQAEGRVRIAPDLATIGVGVVATGEDALTATNAASAQMARVIAGVRAKGVAARDVQTQQIQVEPRFVRSDPNDYQGQARISGYVARNGATVTIRRLATASDVVAAAFGAGANSVSGPSIAREDDRVGIAEARQDAIASARAEADAYAAGFGMRVARVVRISERGSNVARYDNRVRVVAYAGAPPPPPPPPPPPSAVSTPFEAGELLRTTNVWVDFALTPK